MIPGECLESSMILSTFLNNIPNEENSSRIDRMGMGREGFDLPSLTRVELIP
jgi:hypothetical protein